MRCKLFFTGLCLLAGIQLCYALEKETYQSFDITEDANGPLLKVYTSGHEPPNAYFSIRIKHDSKLSEYVMARLINVHYNNFYVGHITQNGYEKYRFFWPTVIQDWYSASGFSGIGFYEKNNELVLELFETTTATPKEFTLKLDETDPLKKIKFDYIIAALVDFYTLGRQNRAIQVITENGKNIGINIK